MLIIEDLNFGYGEKSLFINLSCSFQSGLNVVTGRNGSGKSTLFNLLSGSLSPCSGKISYPSLTTAKPGLAYCRQFMADAFFTSRVEEEIDYTIKYSGSSKKREEVFELLKRLLPDDADFKNRSPFELDYPEQKLLNLVLAMVKDYDLLLLDEIDSGLSFQTKIRLAEFLRQISAKIVIVISHDLWFINALQAPVVELNGQQGCQTYTQPADYLQALNLPPAQLQVLKERELLIKKLATDS